MYLLLNIAFSSNVVSTPSGIPRLGPRDTRRYAEGVCFVSRATCPLSSTPPRARPSECFVLYVPRFTSRLALGESQC